MARADGVCVLCDHSNILLNARKMAVAREGSAGANKLMLKFDHLMKLACRGRTLLRAVVVGSMIPEAQATALASEGVVVERYEADAKGRECAVDQALQVHLLRAGFDFRPAATVVLLTGDGAGYSQGLGFWADAQRLYQIGWEVELMSWNRSCNHRFRKWVAEVGTYADASPSYVAWRSAARSIPSRRTGDRAGMTNLR